MEELWRASSYLEDPDMMPKQGSVALLGLWASKERCFYNLVTTSCPQDLMITGEYHASQTPGSPVVDGVSVFMDYVYIQKVRELTSMRPIHQRCLEEERISIARVMCMIEQVAEIRHDLFSLRVDEVFCRVAKSKREAFKKKVLGLQYKDTHEILPRGRKPTHQRPSSSCQEVFKFKEVDEPVYPGGKHELFEDERPAVETLVWDVREESLDGPDGFAQEIVEWVTAGHSCCVEGQAGTGKTEVLKKIEVALEESGVEVHKICLTHCGARNCGKDASTAHHFVLRKVLHGTIGGGVVMIDEISFMSLSLLAALEHLRLKGIRLICFGDFEQLPPVSNTFRGAVVGPRAFEESRLYKSWSDCTKFVLRRCRRSDQAHFDFYTRARGMPIEQGIREAAQRYPPIEGRADWNIVMSHFRRRLINEASQKAFAAGATETIRIEGEIAYDLCVGTKLVGCNNELKNIVNGGFYIVEALGHEKVKIRDEDLDETFEVKVHHIAKHTRLRHALTVHSVQGRSLEGTIAIHDRRSPHFSPAVLYVALSRAKDGTKVGLM
jgi:hypothetical protein